MLRNTWVSTLNAAMRHMARRDDIPLVDLETLHLQLPAAHLYKEDGLHPRPNLLITVCMNLLLNIYEQSTGRSLLSDALVIIGNAAHAFHCACCRHCSTVCPGHQTCSMMQRVYGSG